MLIKRASINDETTRKILYNQPSMTEEIKENLIGEKLRNLSITELSQATNNFLSLLKNHDPEYFPSAANKEGLVLIAGRYSEEYSPLLREWGRRQNDPNYQKEPYQDLRGQMPDSLLQEMRQLEKKQNYSLDWNPAVEGKRLLLLEKVYNSYKESETKIPYPWLEFFLQNKEEINKILKDLGRKQSREGLNEEERLISNFLTESGVEKILKD